MVITNEIASRLGVYCDTIGKKGDVKLSWIYFSESSSQLMIHCVLLTSALSRGRLGLDSVCTAHACNTAPHCPTLPCMEALLCVLFASQRVVDIC